MISNNSDPTSNYNSPIDYHRVGAFSSSAGTTSGSDSLTTSYNGQAPYVQSTSYSTPGGRLSMDSSSPHAMGSSASAFLGNGAGVTASGNVELAPEFNMAGSTQGAEAYSTGDSSGTFWKSEVKAGDGREP